MESDVGTMSQTGHDPDDRRLPLERRVRPTRFLSRYWLRGRRLDGRRTGEGREIYVDHYRVTEWVIVLTILTLSALDYVLTLVHLKAGGLSLLVSGPVSSRQANSTSKAASVTGSTIITSNEIPKSPGGLSPRLIADSSKAM